MPESPENVRAPGAGLADYAKALPQYLLPHHPLSAMMHRITRIRAGALTTWAIRRFVARFRVNMAEASDPDPAAYPYFNAFFTRALVSGARPLPDDPHDIVSPADGALSQAGAVREGAIIQAKGRSFSVSALLGGGDDGAAAFSHGRFATIYLSPRDYHRVHMPLTGRLREMIYVPGRLFSVSPATTRVIDGLFARNERVVCLFDTGIGPVAIVLVGAIFVGGIEMVWSGPVTPRRPRVPERWRYGDDGPLLERGSEMGRFNMGSTVVLVLPGQSARWSEQLQSGAQLRMGETIGRIARE